MSKNSEATINLIDYLIRESKLEHTEFRLIVRDGGEDCYIHVLNRGSETYDFSLNIPVRIKRELKLEKLNNIKK